MEIPFVLVDGTIPEAAPVIKQTPGRLNAILRPWEYLSASSVMLKPWQCVDNMSRMIR